MTVENKTIKAKIVAISNEIRVDKEGKNSFQGYQYFKPDDILRVLNPLLEKHNLICLFNMEYSKEIEMYKGILTIEGTDVITNNLLSSPFSRSNSSDPVSFKFDIPLTEVKGSSKAQNAGATQTYCKRYMLMNAFNLADNKADPDNKNTKNVVENKVAGMLASEADKEKIRVAAEKIGIKNVKGLEGITKLRASKVLFEMMEKAAGINNKKG